MSAIEIAVPLFEGPERNPNVTSAVDLRIVFGDAVSPRDVLVSLVSSDESGTNLDIPKWPKYRENNLPSKFLRAGIGRELQKLPSVTLPAGSEPSLRIILSSKKNRNWHNWAAILSRPNGDSAFVWYLPFGGSK